MRTSVTIDVDVNDVINDMSPSEIRSIYRELLKDEVDDEIGELAKLCEAQNWTELALKFRRHFPEYF